MFHMLGNESLSLQFGMEAQQSQSGLGRSSRLQQSKEERRPSIGIQTKRPEPKNVTGFAQGMKLYVANLHFLYKGDILSTLHLGNCYHGYHE